MQRILISILTLLLTQVYASYENSTLNISASANTYQGGDYRSTGSIQAIGGTFITGGTYIHYSGSASGFILKPTSSHGTLADEWSFDNDQDGLNDQQELQFGSNLNNLDTDSDELNDYLEWVHGGSPIQADTDADGSSDYKEYIAGTLITDPQSIFSVVYDYNENDGHRIVWDSVLNRVYTIEYTPSLSQSWQAYPFDLPGNNEEIVVQDRVIYNKMFYRVRVRMDN